MSFNELLRPLVAAAAAAEPVETLTAVLSEVEVTAELALRGVAEDSISPELVEALTAVAEGPVAAKMVDGVAASLVV